MSWITDLMHKIVAAHRKWYKFFDELGWTEEQKVMISEWSKKIPSFISMALLGFMKKWYKEYGVSKTNELMDKITKVIDDMF